MDRRTDMILNQSCIILSILCAYNITYLLRSTTFVIDIITELVGNSPKQQGYLLGVSTSSSSGTKRRSAAFHRHDADLHPRRTLFWKRTSFVEGKTRQKEGRNESKTVKDIHIGNFLF